MDYVISIISILLSFYVIFRIKKVKRTKNFLTSSFPFTLIGFAINSQYEIGIKKLKLNGRNTNMNFENKNTYYISDTTVFIEEIKSNIRGMKWYLL